MTQTRRDSKLKQVLGERLRELVDRHLEMSWDELATRLGYATSSTLRQARDGEALLSVEKLVRLAELTTNDGRKVSVDWLLTGEGPALRKVEERRLRATLASRVARANPDVQHMIEAFLEVRGA